MKKSDRLAQVELEARQHSYDRMAEIIVEQETRLGVVWDPEEPMFPKRISSNVYGNLVTAIGPGRCLTARELDEAVRRYNAWEELSKIALDKIQATLEGGNHG